VESWRGGYKERGGGKIEKRVSERWRRERQRKEGERRRGENKERKGGGGKDKEKWK
jgi:hypothetical protein